MLREDDLKRMYGSHSLQVLLHPGTVHSACVHSLGEVLFEHGFRVEGPGLREVFLDVDGEWRSQMFDDWEALESLVGGDSWRFFSAPMSWGVTLAQGPVVSGFTSISTHWLSRVLLGRRSTVGRHLTIIRLGPLCATSVQRPICDNESQDRFMELGSGSVEDYRTWLASLLTSMCTATNAILGSLIDGDASGPLLLSVFRRAVAASDSRFGERISGACISVDQGDYIQVWKPGVWSKNEDMEDVDLNLLVHEYADLVHWDATPASSQD